jgi:hypothetical protein
MREHPPFLTSIACLLLSSCITLAAQDLGTVALQRRSSSAPRKTVDVEGRKAAELALSRLRVLRDGWNDVNREFIRPNLTAGRKLDSGEYEVQYLEARTSVDEALRVLPKGELRTAIAQAMELFDDLEEIRAVFANRSPITTSVRVSDVYPYLKKYNVPYESGIIRGSYGLMLHKDFVMSYILPIRYARVNRVEFLLGGSLQPMPPAPTFEQMYRISPPKPSPPAPPGPSEDELKDIVRKALEARRGGSREWMASLLDEGFVCQGPGGRRWDRREFLAELAPEPSVKSFKFERAVLSSKDGVPVLSTTVKYESFRGEFRSFVNIFTFVNHEGRWLIVTWRAY